MAVKKSLKNLKFDEALAMLEEKVKLLEEGNLPLEESLEVFKEGIELSKICAGRLDTARQTVEQIMETSSGYTTKVIQQNLLRRLMNRWILKNIILTGKN